jgi:hypothetical protein
VIENDKQLQYAYENLAKMSQLRERVLAETLGDPDTQQDVAEGIATQMRKIEREVADYLLEHVQKAA